VNDEKDIVRLSVPGTLQYRHVVLRVVASVCRLVRYGQQSAREPCHATDFDDKVVSAVGEAFNNVAIHAYGGREPGVAELELHVYPDKLTISLADTGSGFSMSAEVGQELDALRESHMGIEIMLACMDEVKYLPGGGTGPNVLTMTKRCPAQAAGVRFPD
jgi:serine/threonine-protein kinase RsbW